ncbi:hypothetical protein KC851_02660 [Candidatus Kaiserbacteria bacterium]|nr:hypothetical protein [Candidatus Kaiserbacteria bacterium]
MSEENQTNKIAELLGLEKMTPEQQEALLARFGSLILDSSLNRLLIKLDDAQVGELQDYMESLPETENILVALAEKYPNFEDIIKEETKALQDEVEKVLG